MLRFRFVALPSVGFALLFACTSGDSQFHQAGGDLPAPDDPSLTGPPLHHVLSTGQSNSVGFAAKPPLSKAQPYDNLMFDVGVMSAADCDGEGCKRFEEPSALVPLVEGDVYDSEPVETMSSGFANEVSLLTGGDRQLLVSVHGRSGNTYECLRKGSCAFLEGKGYLAPFEEALKQMRKAHELATAARRPYRVDAVTAIHGESDHVTNTFPLDGVADYGAALVAWQADYEAAVRAETKQTEGVPLFISQMSNWNDREGSDIPRLQLAAHEAAPGKVVLIGATYMLPFAKDCIHYTNEGERRLGEYFAKAYKTVVRDGKAWEPVRPREVSLDDATITVRFHVPAPPLVLDTERVTDPNGAFGFEYTDDAADTPTIDDVQITAPDTVQLRLSFAPTGGDRHLRYAMRATPETCPGPTTGPRGNLRDSDATKSQTGVDLSNWAIAFDTSME